MDPRRDVDVYLREIESRGLKLKGILLSHVHADFVSGHLELHERSGATICVSSAAPVTYPHLPCDDGEYLVLTDRYAMKALHTPGHTPGCITWLIVDRTNGDRPLDAFTGDTLFVGSCGRPDLLGSMGLTKEEMSHKMFKTLTEKIMKLPEDCVVYPAHGAGSPCGKSLGKELNSTIGKEIKTNPTLQFTDVDEFTKFVTSDQPHAPQYFLNAVHQNISGAANVAVELGKVNHLGAQDFSVLRHSKAHNICVLDTRDNDDFAEAHIPGAINISIGKHAGITLSAEEGNFAIWVGTIIAPTDKILVVADLGKEQETLERLLRIGYNNAIAVLRGGMEAWKAAGLPIANFKRYGTTPDVFEHLKEQDYTIVDIRTEGEFQCPAKGHVKNSICVPLNKLKEMAPDKLPLSGKFALLCIGGFRSVIAASVLLGMGYSDVTDFHGGYYKIMENAKEWTTMQRVEE